MGHTIEAAASGRSRCRGCGEKIAKDELRLGERLPNPYAEEREMTLWYHLRCGAFKRPQVLLEAVTELTVEVEDLSQLQQAASLGVEQRRLPRIDGVQRAPTGRARCRSCRELIPKENWRIALVFYEQGHFNPSGYLHLECTKGYLGTTDIVDRLAHFASDLSPADIAEIERALSD